MVGSVDRMVDLVNMGRDLRARNDPAGDLEQYGCATILREARTDKAAADHGDRDKRGGRAAWADGVDAVAESASVRALRVLLGLDVLLCYLGLYTSSVICTYRFMFSSRLGYGTPSTADNLAQTTGQKPCHCWMADFTPVCAQKTPRIARRVTS